MDEVLVDTVEQGLPTVGQFGTWIKPLKLQPMKLRDQPYLLADLVPAKPLSCFHTNVRLCYSQTHHCLRYLQGGPGAPESRQKTPAARSLTAHVLPASDTRLRGPGEPMKVFKQGKDITQVGLLTVRFDITRMSQVSDPGSCDWRLHLGFFDFLIERVVNKCNFILVDTYGHTVDIQ